MIDLINAVVIAVVFFVGGAAFHSLWRHAKDRKELEDWYKVEHE